MIHQGQQQPRVRDIEGPMVIVPPGRQDHVGAEPVRYLLVGMLGLAEPQVQALFYIRRSMYSMTFSALSISAVAI